jgi:hypothetical protein
MHCHDAPITIQGVTEEPPESVYKVKDIFESQIRPVRPFEGNIVLLNGASFFCTVKKGNLTIFKASLYDINKAIEAKDLKKGETLTWGPLYSMSRAKLVGLKEGLEENMSKGFIRQSSSPFSTPVLVAKITRRRVTILH